MNNNKDEFDIQIKKDLEKLGLDDKNSYQKIVNDHHHSHHEIIFVTQGEAQFSIENKTFNLKKNSLLFIANFERHNCKIISYPYERYFALLSYAFFDMSLLDKTLMSAFINRPDNLSPSINLKDNEAIYVSNIFNTLLDENTKTLAYYKKLVNTKVFELLVFLFRTHPSSFAEASDDKYSDTVFKVQQHLHENFRSEISLKSVASHFYTDMFYLSTKFKKYVGYTFKQYLTNLRLSFAKELLITTNLKVSEISERAGYNDVTNFIRAFTSIEKISPSKFRKSSNK